MDRIAFKNVTENALLILTVTTGVGYRKGFCRPVVHKLSPQGVLLGSAILAT
jgi:hypothetical protein